MHLQETTNGFSSSIAVQAASCLALRESLAAVGNGGADGGADGGFISPFPGIRCCLRCFQYLDEVGGGAPD